MTDPRSICETCKGEGVVPVTVTDATGQTIGTGTMTCQPCRGHGRFAPVHTRTDAGWTCTECDELCKGDGPCHCCWMGLYYNLTGTRIDWNHVVEGQDG